MSVDPFDAERDAALDDVMTKAERERLRLVCAGVARAMLSNAEELGDAALGAALRELLQVAGAPPGD